MGSKQVFAAVFEGMRGLNVLRVRMERIHHFRAQQECTMKRLTWAFVVILSI